MDQQVKILVAMLDDLNSVFMNSHRAREVRSNFYLPSAQIQRRWAHTHK